MWSRHQKINIQLINGYSDDQIINWLEKNKSHKSNHHQFRERIELVWFEKNNKRINYSLSLFGQNISVLKDLFLDD